MRRQGKEGRSIEWEMEAGDRRPNKGERYVIVTLTKRSESLKYLGQLHAFGLVRVRIL